MALNDIIFKKENGGMGRTAANEDVVSGLIMSMVGGLTAGNDKWKLTNGLQVAKLSFFEQLSDDFGFEETVLKGLTSPALEVAAAKNAVIYHVREFFRMSPTGTLYLAVKPTGEVTADEIKSLQCFAEGKIRQVGVFTATLVSIDDYQAAATELESEHQPLSIIIAPAKATLTLNGLKVEGQYTEKDRSNVSILVGADLDPVLAERIGDFAQYGCIGTCLGAVSKAAVHECIAWVGKFPLGLKVPGFITGEQVRDVSTDNLKLLNNARLIFVRTHVGDSDSYFNDSHTLDTVTSDYAFIENVRTMDKAVRGIRTNLLPHLNAPLYVDAASGKIALSTVSFLENEASRALEAMEKAGELSGYRAEINPEQNVLATSELEVVIKNVPVGVMRKVTVKIGYTTKL